MPRLPSPLRCAPLALLFACADPHGPKVFSEVTDELPPTSGEADLAPWLATGAYKKWSCEPAPHRASGASGHSKNRICSNGIIANHDPASGAWPVGAASVKELYDGDRIVGYAVARKVTAGVARDGGPTSTGTDAAAWYWYERDDGTLYADGLGTENAPKTLCGDCHSRGTDFVYTAVSAR
jgi:hypothetical protein